MSFFSDDCHVSWRRSSYSIANGDCVEVAEQLGEILLRDSKDPVGWVLRCSPKAWRVCVAALRTDR